MKKWNIAAYLRLSSDDRDKSESSSIGNQRNIIKQYIKTNNLNVNANYYIDDGYSGTTFERPDFKKMIKDIKDNKNKLYYCKRFIKIRKKLYWSRKIYWWNISFI